MTNKKVAVLIFLIAVMMSGIFAGCNYVESSTDSKISTTSEFNNNQIVKLKHNSEVIVIPISGGKYMKGLVGIYDGSSDGSIYLIVNNKEIKIHGDYIIIPVNNDLEQIKKEYELG